MSSAPAERERLRQQMLVRTLLRDTPHATLQGWMREAAPRAGRALEAYAANAGASAERALGTGFPVLRALIGDESFAQLARAYWHALPPARGDLAWLGELLPAFIADADQLAAEPYLADCARLEWALQRAELASDAQPEPQTLSLLGVADPDEIGIELMPGTAVLASTHPIVSIWQAHQSGNDADDRYAMVRAAFAAGTGERAWVWREGWRARAALVDHGAFEFMRALLAGRSLGNALAAAQQPFDFEAWLVLALERGSVRRAFALQSRSGTPTHTGARSGST